MDSNAAPSTSPEPATTASRPPSPEDAYRARWRWDSVSKGTHLLNCWYQRSCAYNVYVKGDTVAFEEPVANYPQTNASVPDFNPRGCQKGARFHVPGEPLKIEELPDPQPGRGQVVVNVQACGICGSDVHFWEGHAPVAQTPITLGHEPAGTIEAAGENVDSIEPGQRVVVRAGSSCGRCAACRAGRDGLCERSQVLGMHIDGGLAERLLVNADEVLPVPDAVPIEQAAIIGDAVATPYHALVERGGLRPGETVAVFGCGGLGYHAIRIARLAGAATIIAVDVRATALERATEAGADITVNASEERAARRIRELTGGVDLAIECVGRAESIGEAVKSLRRGGRAVVVGMGPEKIALPPPNIFTWSEYSLIGSFGSSAATVELLLTMVASGRLDLSQSITERLPLEDVNQGLELLRSPESDVVRIVVEPN